MFTMPSYITKTKTIRIKNEVYDYFNDKPLNRMVESLKELLENGSVVFDGEHLKTNGKPAPAEIDISDFLSWCKSKNANPQIVMNNIMAEIRKNN